MFANADSKDSEFCPPRFQILSWICLKWECFADAASFWSTAAFACRCLASFWCLAWLALSLAICPSEHHDDMMHLLR